MFRYPEFVYTNLDSRELGFLTVRAFRNETGARRLRPVSIDGFRFNRQNKHEWSSGQAATTQCFNML